MGYKGRDVEVVALDNNYSIVIACDSCGGIGLKENDVVKVSPYIAGRFTTKVSLMEVLSVNALPKTISITISNELSPTGEEIIKGAIDELRTINLESIPIAISTEKNIKTSQTALGITVIGICENENIRVTKTKSGASVYCLGIPKVGNELTRLDDIDIVQISHIKKLLNLDQVCDIVPIGSQGILKEIETLCQNIACKFIYESDKYIDLYKSAGPSTCLIFTCSGDADFSELTLKPLKLGMLKGI